MVESFTERWRRREQELGLVAIHANMIACGADVLPDSAAPFVSFKGAGHPIPAQDMYGVPSEWSQMDRERLAPFRVIGSDGAGNPFCLKDDTGEIVVLDHEDGFRTAEFVNSSVRQLGECLLAYMGERDPARFRSAVRGIDPPALADGAFWWHEAACLGGGS